MSVKSGLLLIVAEDLAIRKRNKTELDEVNCSPWHGSEANPMYLKIRH